MVEGEIPETVMTHLPKRAAWDLRVVSPGRIFDESNQQRLNGFLPRPIFDVVEPTKKCE